MLAQITNWVIHVIGNFGYTGIAVLMAIGSVAIPLPSEVVMAFSGFLVSTGQMSMVGISLAGAIGSVLGSWLLYAVGYFGGRPLVEKYGKYIFMDAKDLERSSLFFTKYGAWSAFLGRMIPIVRAYVSFPAGIYKQNFWSFTFYTFLGSLIWAALLGYIGLALGHNWQHLSSYFHGINLVLGILIVLGLLWFFRRPLMRILSRKAQH